MPKSWHQEQKRLEAARARREANEQAAADRLAAKRAQAKGYHRLMARRVA